MADSKNTQLSITLKAIDKASGPIKALNARLDKMTKPISDFKSEIADLGEKSGFKDVMAGFKGVGSAIGDLLGKVAMIGGVAGLAVAGLLGISHEYDNLGKTAKRLGVGVDYLAGMRDAAERAGVPVEELDTAFEMLSKNIGKARIGTGRMAAFLPKVTTDLHADFGSKLLSHLKSAKDNAAAVDALSDAFSRLKNPADRAALAMATLGDEKLADMFTQGPKTLKDIRDHFSKLAPGQAAAAEEAAKVAEKMRDLKASTDGVKAALLTGLGPAIEKVAEKMTNWLTGHQSEIAAWVKDIGDRLPGAIDTVSDAISDAFDGISKFVDSIGGIKTVAIALGAVLVGPLMMAITTLSVALLTTPFGVFLIGIAGIIAALTHLKEIKDWALGNVMESLDAVANKAKKEGRDARIDELLPAPKFVFGEAPQIDVPADAGSTHANTTSALIDALRKTPGGGGMQQRSSVDVKVTVDGPKSTRVKTESTGDGINVFTGLNLWGLSGG